MKQQLIMTDDGPRTLNTFLDEEGEPVVDERLSDVRLKDAVERGAGDREIDGLLDDRLKGPRRIEEHAVWRRKP